MRISRLVYIYNIYNIYNIYIYIYISVAFEVFICVWGTLRTGMYRSIFRRKVADHAH